MQRQNGPGAEAVAAPEGSEQSFTKRAAAVAHETVDVLQERLEPREERLREAAQTAEEQLREATERARETYKDLADEARAYVREHPLTSAALAFAAGVIVISWIRR